MDNVITPPPAVEISIAIPMYNAEKYIGACLQSILAQTFQNYEVVIVDDCSTDNSVEVVNSYIPKFGGRLKLFHTEINSGSPSFAYSKAIFLSSGKYVYVIDNDDLMVNNALEILYKYAEAANADVVHMDRNYYFMSDAEKIFPTNADLRIRAHHNAVNAATLFTGSMEQRLQQVCHYNFYVPPWHKLVKRSLLIEHDIVFPDLRASADVGWTIQVVCHAERILRIPQPLYIWRENPKSITHKKRQPQEAVNFWADMFVNGMKYFDDWTSRQKFFVENPQYKYMIFDVIAHDYLANMRNTIKDIPVTEYQSLLENKIKSKLGENSASTAYLLASSTLLRMNNELLVNRLIELENNLRALQADSKE